jgi:threonine/homoserine/homoserine lactone efflux protein
MELAAFLASVVLISLSGVLAPGPLLAATIAEGRTNRFAGFFITLGHALFEIPIILGLFVFGTVAASQSLQSAIGLIGGIVLLFFAYRELHSTAEVRPARGVVTGIAMSSLNPYFIVWWLTVGFHLVLQSTAFGLLGIGLFILAHEACDGAWLGFVAFMSHKSSQMFGPKAEYTLSLVSVSILVVFGGYFIVSGAQGLLA